MIEYISKLNEAHLCFRELEKDEFDCFKQLEDKFRSGINPKSLKSYVCLVIYDDCRAEYVLNECAVNIERVELSYHISSDVRWGDFTIPKEGVALASKYGLSIRINYATPQNR